MSIPVPQRAASSSSEAVPGVRSRRHQPYRPGPIHRMVMQARNSAVDFKRWYFRRVLKMDLHPNCRFSLKARLDFTNPRGVHVGSGTYLAFGAVILAHDMSRLVSANTWIGKNCFVGANAIVMPGVSIGDECIVGSGAVVTQDVPSHSIVAGNPAKIVKSGIRTREWGILVEAYEERLARSMAKPPGA